MSDSSEKAAPAPAAEAETSSPSRRTLVRGVAWAAPVVAVSVTAPTYAASPCTTTSCPSIFFGPVAGNDSATAGNGWSYVSSGTGWSNPNPVGFQPEVKTSSDVMYRKGPHFSAASEPTTKDRQLTVSQTGQPPLAAGCSYSIRFGVVTHTNAGSMPLVLRVLVGTVQVGALTTSSYNNAGYVDRGYQLFAVPSTSSGSVSFVFQFGDVGDHHDIKLYEPSVICN